MGGKRLGLARILKRLDRTPWGRWLLNACLLAFALLWVCVLVSKWLK